MNRFLSFSPKDIPQPELHAYLVSAVAPRPIGFASTVDANGRVNLAPYSFFNCFSSNPPICVFSSNRRGGNASTKDTLHNVQQTKEVVLNVVNHAIVRQMSLCSIDYSADINEFEKAGLTPLASEVVTAPRVAESPVQMECRVNDIVSLGNGGGAGNLIICEIVKMHINKNVLNEKNEIDVMKIDQVARLGKAYYARLTPDSVFKLYQPFQAIAIGFDKLPLYITHASQLSGNEIAEMAALTELPEAEVHTMDENTAFITAKKLIQQGEAKKALAILLHRNK